MSCLHRVRQALRQPAALGLSRLSRPARGELRSALRARRLHARLHRARSGQHLALRASCCPSPKASSPTFPSASRRWSAPTAWASASAQPASTSRTTPSAFPPSASRTAWLRSRWPTRATSASSTVGCSSTGNLANSVAAQAARLGLKACILVPADLEPAKILNTLVYGARLDPHRRQLRSRQPSLHRRLPTSTTGASSTSTCAPTTPRAPRPSATRSPSSSAGACRTTSSCPWPAAA